MASVTITENSTADDAAGGASDRHQDDLPKILRPRPLGVFLIVASAIGLLASFELSVDKIRLLRDPGAVLSCDFNPLFSCSSVMGYPQSELFGFPNQFIGLVAFVFPLLLGVLLVAGTQVPRWVMLGLNIGLLGGVAFVTFLQYTSLFVIGIGCPWCMVVWAVTIPLFVLVTAHNALAGGFGAGVQGNVVARAVAGMPLSIAGLWLFGVAIAVVLAFWSYFSGLLLRAF